MKIVIIVGWGHWDKSNYIWRLTGCLEMIPWTHHGERGRNVSSSSTRWPTLHHANDIRCDIDNVRVIIKDLHPYASSNYNNALEEDDDAMGDDLFRRR